MKVLLLHVFLSVDTISPFLPPPFWLGKAGWPRGNRGRAVHTVLVHSALRDLSALDVSASLLSFVYETMASFFSHMSAESQSGIKAVKIACQVHIAEATFPHVHFHLNCQNSYWCFEAHFGGFGTLLNRCLQTTLGRRALACIPFNQLTIASRPLVSCKA